MKLVKATLTILLVGFLGPIGFVGQTAHAEDDRINATARIRPLEPSEWSPKFRNKLASIGRVRVSTEGSEEKDASGDNRKRAPGMLKTVSHHPDLLVPFLDFATVITYHGALSPRESELLALRVSWNCQSEFEWGHHVDYALDAGLSRAQITQIPHGASGTGWSKIDQALLTAADQLHAKQQITDEVWATLASAYSEKQLIEILFVVGEYTMLSMVVNASGVELEEGFDRLPVLAQSD